MFDEIVSHCEAQNREIAKLSPNNSVIATDSSASLRFFSCFDRAFPSFPSYKLANATFSGIPAIRFYQLWPETDVNFQTNVV